MDLIADAAMAFLEGDDILLIGSDPSLVFKAYVDFPEQIEMFAGQSKPGQMMERPTMTYATAAPGRQLTRSDAVTHKGTSYGLQNIRKIQDGAVSVADLVKA